MASLSSYFENGASLYKRELVIVVTVVVAVALGSVAAAPGLKQLLGGAGRPQVISDVVASLAAMVETRSPGERTSAMLMKTKGEAAKLTPADTDSAPAPRQRALSRSAPGAAAPVSENSLPAEILPPIALPLDGGEAIPFDLPPGPLLGGVSSPGVLLPISGGGGGGGAGGGGGDGVANPPIVTPTEPVAPVPEPATWATMLLGFALTGLILRRRSRISAAVG